ncbi:hypothetical protein [Halegenticoccus tardaugens]|uniref:hypothetical protein n=1 Tax=Halegenticoccus tardaugens TaxID=2071624 RepID=UPI00100BA172|nr:hypothetical protein [Halegenticoccus tardaugens]
MSNAPSSVEDRSSRLIVDARAALLRVARPLVLPLRVFAFWTAVVVPAFYFHALYHGFWPRFVLLVCVHAVALLLGRNHNRG